MTLMDFFIFLSFLFKSKRKHQDDQNKPFRTTREENTNLFFNAFHIQCVLFLGDFQLILLSIVGVNNVLIFGLIDSQKIDKHFANKLHSCVRKKNRKGEVGSGEKERRDTKYKSQTSENFMTNPYNFACAYSLAFTPGVVFIGTETLEFCCSTIKETWWFVCFGCCAFS
jgi:hypothetical protein